MEMTKELGEQLARQWSAMAHPNSVNLEFTNMMTVKQKSGGFRKMMINSGEMEVIELKTGKRELLILCVVPKDKGYLPGNFKHVEIGWSQIDKVTGHEWLLDAVLQDMENEAVSEKKRSKSKNKVVEEETMALKRRQKANPKFGTW